MIRARRIVSIVQDALDVCPALVLVAVVLISCLLAFLGLWLELRAAWAWVETGVYTAPLLGTVFPGVAQEVDASLAQLALTRPWLVPAARTVLVDLWAEAHVGFLGIVLCVGVVSFCAYLSEVAEHHRQGTKPRDTRTRLQQVHEQLAYAETRSPLNNDIPRPNQERRWVRVVPLSWWERLEGKR